MGVRERTDKEGSMLEVTDRTRFTSFWNDDQYEDATRAALRRVDRIEDTVWIKRDGAVVETFQPGYDPERYI
jgi:hypothetical protein